MVNETEVACVEQNWVTSTVVNQKLTFLLVGLAQVAIAHKAAKKRSLLRNRVLRSTYCASLKFLGILQLQGL